MTVAELRNLFDAARPLVKQWLDLSEQFSAFRLTATEKGFDWSQIKALLKAQAQDERDGGDKHVRRIIERAEFASSYAAQLGLMNENNYSDEPKSETEVQRGQADKPTAPAPKGDEPMASAMPAAEPAVGGAAKTLATAGASAAPVPFDAGPDMPSYLRRVG